LSLKKKGVTSSEEEFRFQPETGKKGRGPLDWTTRIEEVTPRFPSTLDMKVI